MDRLAIIGSESERFAQVLAAVEPSLRCPTCPNWTSGDLLWHLTRVHFFWATVLSRLIQSEADLEPIRKEMPVRPDGIAEILALRAKSTSLLLDQLAIREDAEQCWSWWTPDQTVGFTRRMQTYEALMHRVDAELTAGLSISPIAADVAAGAIDQAVDVMWGRMPQTAAYRAHSVAELVATDTGQRWLVELGTWRVTSRNAGAPPADGLRAVRASAGDPTAIVRAPVHELALWSWTRGGTVDTSGVARSIATLNAVVRQGIQ